MSTETAYPNLDETQRARVAALEAARAVLRGVGLGATRVEVTDLHSLATFILNGSDPWGVADDGDASDLDKFDDEGPQTFDPSPIVQAAQAQAARDALSEVMRRFARAEIGPQGRAMLSTDRLRVVVDEMLETLGGQG